MKRVLLIICTIVMLAALAAVAIYALHHRQHKPTTQATTVNQPNQKDRSELRAVEAAANAVDQLRRSILLPPLQRWHTIYLLVDPSQRDLVYKQMSDDSVSHRGHPALWAQWGYDTRLVAYVRSDYSVDTKAFRLVSYNGSTAQIALFVYYHWKSVNSGDLVDCAIVIEKMHLVQGHWLFVTEEQPPVSEVPDLAGGGELTFDERVNLFKPYLKGFAQWPSSWPLKPYTTS